MGETFLVTGAAGCIGAWAVKILSDEGARVIAADLSSDPVRPRLLMSDAALDALEWLKLDVTDTDASRRAVAENGVDRIVHLAGLQIPFCAANPPLGAAVNVIGTVNIFEAARHEGVKGLAYASSVAALGPAEIYDTWPLPDDAARVPATLYGVYKVANEETARIYARDWGVPSVGLRPAIVYGVGRDQGVTSDIAKAVLAAAVGRPYHIRFSGPVSLQHGSDMARMFIGAARARPDGAVVCNVRGDVIDVADFIALLQEIEPGAAITAPEAAPLFVPSDLDDAALRTVLGTLPHTPLADAIRADLAMYRDLHARGMIDLGQLER